jgi:hypothetical protein
MKSIAIMQPYIFPYVGYFQLINAVDEFVFYDDVNFIKRGWINRNRILVNKQENVFSVPLTKISSFTLIHKIELHPVLFDKWRIKFIKTLIQSYRKSPNFNLVFPLIEDILNFKTNNIANYAINSIQKIADYLDVSTNFSVSSDKFPHSRGIDRADRLKTICELQEAKQYINALGGQELYNKEFFLEDNIQLNFLNPNIDSYNQFDNEFISGLSIIDILMFNDKKDIMKMLNSYNLV